MTDIQLLQAEIQASEDRFLAVDIDETLSETMAYYMSGLQQLLGNPEQLSTREIMEKYTYFVSVPYWDHEKIWPWIEEQRNSNDTQESIGLITGSNVAVTELSSLISILYLTARPEAVEVGTRTWLETHKFPTGRIVTRPPHIPFEATNTWKADVLTSLYPHVIGIIDDNPRLAQGLSAEYQGTVFAYGHLAFTCKRTDISILPCSTWDETSLQVKKVIAKLTGVPD